VDPLPNLSFTGSRYTVAEPFQVSGESYDGRIPYCFLHIPKTAGTTIHFVLKAAIDESFPSGDANYTRFRVPRVEGESPISIKPGWIGSWPTVLAEAATYSPPPRRRFVSAHCPFGFHEPLRLAAARYFTLVRDPVAREVSSFNFRYQRGFLPQDASLISLLEAGAILDNPQVRMLAGLDAMSAVCTRTTLSRARENIERDFQFAACDDQSSSFISALLGFFGLPPVAYVRSQVTGMKLISHPDAVLRERLYGYHAFDHELVTWVRDRWNAWAGTYLTRRRGSDSSDMVLAVGPDFASERKARVLSRAELNVSSDDSLLVQLAKE